MNNSIDKLYKKASNESTPTKLDNLILNAAKQSCEPEVKHKARRWMFPLATAAVFVMGFSVIFNLQNINDSMQVAPSYTESDPTTEINFIEENEETPQTYTARKRTLKKNPDQLKTVKPPVFEVKALEKKEIINKQGLAKAKLPMKQVPKEAIVDLVHPKPQATPVLELSTRKVDTLATVSTHSVNVTTEQESVIDMQEATMKGTEQENYLLPNDANLSKESMANVEHDKSTGAIISDQAVESSQFPIEEISGSKEKVNATNLAAELVTSTPKLQRQVSSLKTQLLKLQELINENKYDKAKELLILLKKQYENFDFTMFEKQILDSMNQ